MRLECQMELLVRDLSMKPADCIFQGRLTLFIHEQYLITPQVCLAQSNEGGEDLQCRRLKTKKANVFCHPFFHFYSVEPCRNSH